MHDPRTTSPAAGRKRLRDVGVSGRVGVAIGRTSLRASGGSTRAVKDEPALSATRTPSPRTKPTGQAAVGTRLELTFSVNSAETSTIFGMTRP
jgi:hypothetical protein